MPTSGPHILVVDDDPSIREGLATALKGTYVVHDAATGAEACALLRRHPIAAIVLDALLGAEHGLDLIERFRAISPAPIVMLTGYGSEALAIRALRAKVNDYLSKPFKLPELRIALARLVLHDSALDPVARACRLLDEHPERQHTTESLAKEVGLSERHLHRRFTEAYGKTPRRYLTEVRLEGAADLLRTTPHGIEQIAVRVGYPNIAWFDKIFKRAYGITPSEFRARHKKAGDHAPGGSDSTNG